MKMPLGLVNGDPFSLSALTDAWESVMRVAEKDVADRGLSHGITSFMRDAETRLASLADELAAGTYVPADLIGLEISDGDHLRRLAVPAVRDRVVARAILELVTPVVDPLLGPASFAYRPGLGVRDAVQAVAQLRDNGLSWVVRTDIDNCFAHLPVARGRDLLDQSLTGLPSRQKVMSVVDLLHARLVKDRGGRRAEPGLPQGCPLSPVIANLILAHVDRAIMDHGYCMVRYADDICVCVRSEEQARQALDRIGKVVSELGMSLGVEDTEIMSFAQGFSFLGEDFGPRYPPLVEGDRVVEPAAKVVYVASQGGRIRVRAGRLIVENSQEVKVLDVPTAHVSRLVCFGSVGLSAGARA